MSIVSMFGRQRQRFTSRDAKGVWDKVFTTKDERFLNTLRQLKTDEERLFLFKLCYRAEPSIKKMVIVSKEKWYTTFSSRIYDWLGSDTGVEVRLRFERIINWMHHVGYDQEVWDSI